MGIRYVSCWFYIIQLASRQMQLKALLDSSKPLPAADLLTCSGPLLVRLEKEAQPSINSKYGVCADLAYFRQGVHIREPFRRPLQASISDLLPVSTIVLSHAGSKHLLSTSAASLVASSRVRKDYITLFGNLFVVDSAAKSELDAFIAAEQRRISDTVCSTSPDQYRLSDKYK